VLLIDGASTCVGCGVEKEGKESFEDRRHASNMNPYLVEAMRISTNPPHEILLLVEPWKDLYQ
jgi:glutamine synthetase